MLLTRSIAKQPSITSANASSNCSTDPSSVYRRHKQAKKQEYGQRIREVERGVFTSLVFSTTGGVGREALTFYKRLADMIAQKRQHDYSAVMGWLRCRLSMASLRASIMCIRGSRSSFHCPVYGSDITLSTSDFLFICFKNISKLLLTL